jgi:hypothetical protein
VLQSSFRLETKKEPQLASDHFIALGEYTLTTKYFNNEAIVSPIKKKVDVQAIINKIVQTKFSGGEFLFPNPYV